MRKGLIQATPAGFYCPAGDFYIDPMRPVERAIITHAHADHVRAGSEQYICTEEGLDLLRHRLSGNPYCQPKPYGEPFQLGKATVSFHPAGHILGSAQVRVEVNGEVWVISGDYKRDPDPTCRPFEVVPCEVFITEATFALPVYRWQPTEEIAREIFDWWMACRAEGKTAVLFCYSLGKSQRVLAELTRFTQEPVYLHESVDELTRIYRQAGVKMLPSRSLKHAQASELVGQLVIAPPGTSRATWISKLEQRETGFASGWMRVRANRKTRNYGQGFILSDHADWPQLVRTVRETQAKKVWVTHGKSDLLVRYLNESGISAAEWN